MSSATVIPPSFSSSSLSTTVATRATMPAMRYYRRLPPEIWLRIFPLLSSSDLQAVTLTCKLFLRLSQPLLFSVFDVSPFFLSYSSDNANVVPIPGDNPEDVIGNGNIRRLTLRPRKYLDRTVARLAFYASTPHIAPLVTHVWVSPYTRSGKFLPRSPRDYLDPALVVDALMAHVAVFTSLRRISWHCLDLERRWWDRLCSLRGIERVWLNACTVKWNPDRSAADAEWDREMQSPPLMGGVRHLDLDQWAWEGQVTNHVSIHEERSAGVSADVFPLVFSPTTTEHVSVPREDTAARLMSYVVSRSTALADVGAVNGLRTLRVPYFVIADLAFVDALACCSSLRELCVFPPTTPTSLTPFLISMPNPDSVMGDAVPSFAPVHISQLVAQKESVRLVHARLPSVALQVLEVYSGPYVLLQSLVGGVSKRRVAIRRARVWGLREVSSGDRSPKAEDEEMVEVLRRLGGLGPLSTCLEDLEVSLGKVTEGLVEAIGGFRQLKHLGIESLDGDDHHPAYGHTDTQNKGTIEGLYALISSRADNLPKTLTTVRLQTKLHPPRKSVTTTTLVPFTSPSKANQRPSQAQIHSPTPLFRLRRRRVSGVPSLVMRSEEGQRIQTVVAQRTQTGAEQRQLAIEFVEDALLRRCKGLREVEIGYGTYWTGRCGVRWGRVVPSGYPVHSERDEVQQPERVSESGAGPAGVGVEGRYGRLRFEEHRRTIVFPDTRGPVSSGDGASPTDSSSLSSSSVLSLASSSSNTDQGAGDANNITAGNMAAGGQAGHLPSFSSSGSIGSRWKWWLYSPIVGVGILAAVKKWTGAE